MDLTRPLLGSVVLCGGTSDLKNFEKRLTNELKDLVAHQVSREVRVTTAQHPQAAAWHGGKVFAGLRSGFTDRWMSREEFFEFGPERMRRKLGDSPQKFED
jgi:actin-related protein